MRREKAEALLLGLTFWLGAILVLGVLPVVMIVAIGKAFW